MRFEDIMPSLRAGRRVRRAAWKNDEYACMEQRIGMPPPDTVQKHTFASYHTWPDVRESSELTAEDWEIIPEPAKDGYFNGNYRDAMEMVNAESRRTKYEPQAGWETLAKRVIGSIVEALHSSGDEESAREHITRAAVDAIGALTAMAGARDFRRVMRG